MSVKHEIKVRVRYSETDQMGVVYHGNYAPFLEIGRVEWLRNLGISYKSMEENGIMLPVVSLHMEYKRPAYYDQNLTVKTILKEKPSRKLIFNYEILNEKENLVMLASSSLVFVNMKTKKTINCPLYITEKIEGLI